MGIVTRFEQQKLDRAGSVSRSSLSLACLVEKSIVALLRFERVG